MFTRIAGVPPETVVAFDFEGRRMTATPGQSVASALAEANCGPLRHTFSGAPRAAYCMMGVCFECLVTIDGVPLRQACLVPVRQGMRVARSESEVEAS